MDSNEPRHRTSKDLSTTRVDTCPVSKYAFGLYMLSVFSYGNNQENKSRCGVSCFPREIGKMIIFGLNKSQVSDVLAVLKKAYLKIYYISKHTILD